MKQCRTWKGWDGGKTRVAAASGVGAQGGGWQWGDRKYFGLKIF